MIRQTDQQLARAMELFDELLELLDRAHLPAVAAQVDGARCALARHLSEPEHLSTSD